MSSIPEAQKVTFCTILKNITKTNIILTFLSLIKIHLEKSQKNFVTRLRRNGRSLWKLSHVCGGFNENHIALSLACIYQARGTKLLSLTAKFSLLEQNMQYVCGAVNESCKTYSTSAVPLLVRNVQYVCGAVARNLWNISKTKLKKHWFS